MAKIFSVFLFLIFTIPSFSTVNANVIVSSKPAKLLNKLTTEKDIKPKRVFRLKETEKEQHKKKPKNKDKKFIPTESISEDLSVPFPIDI